MNPLIVRKIVDSDEYEILAGHNRKRASIEAGLKTVPCRIVDVDDVDASVLVAVTNNQREEVSDIEWARSYRDTYEALVKSKGGDRKSDNFEKIERSNFNEKSNGHGVHLIPEDKKEKKTTFDIVAEKYGINYKTLQRKIRLAYLNNQMLELFNNKKITQGQAINLSHLSDMEQIHVYSTILEFDYKITDDVSKNLRALADEKDEDLTNDEIRNYMMQTYGDKPENKKKKTKLPSYFVDGMLFPKSIEKKERQSYVNVILAYVLEHEEILKEIYKN
ncbi:MAG: ParB N-terminal domain-containing protein [Eubacteriales bacterium]|nr:ParB N-terminal domain-containing protein [Eubacteriales bacterium]MDY3332165.1 ParB N-terminal domain-containing protein [Gallibacter sp.]